MSVISLFSAFHCHGNEVAQKVRDKLGYDALSNAHLLLETSKRFQIPEDKLRRAMMYLGFEQKYPLRLGEEA